MADLMTKPKAWLRTLSDAELDAAIARVPDWGPLGAVNDNYGWQQEIDGVEYRIAIGWAKFERQVRDQLRLWKLERAH